MLYSRNLIEIVPSNISAFIRNLQKSKLFAECPHCGDYTSFWGEDDLLFELWEANTDDETRYYLFHEPYQFLERYYHNLERIEFRTRTLEERRAFLSHRQKGSVQNSRVGKDM